jgi:hypothetical protein
MWARGPGTEPCVVSLGSGFSGCGVQCVEVGWGCVGAGSSVDLISTEPFMCTIASNYSKRLVWAQTCQLLGCAVQTHGLVLGGSL